MQTKQHGFIVQLKHTIGTIEEQAHAYVRPQQNLVLIPPLVEVLTLLAIYDNEYGYPDPFSTDVDFNEFKNIFGQYRNGMEDRGENCYGIESVAELSRNEQDALEIVIPLVSSITVVNPSVELYNLYTLLKICMNEEQVLEFHDVEQNNPSLAKAIFLMRDLIREQADEEFQDWNDALEERFITEFSK